MVQREISLREVEQQGPNDPIWVLNCADESKHKLIGDIRIMIPKHVGSGDPDPIILPATWLPQEITKDVPRAQLLATSALRQAASKGLLKFITHEYAMELLNSEGAEEAQAELDEADDRARNAGVAKTLDQTPVDILMANGKKEDTETSPAEVYGGTGTQGDFNAVDDMEPGISATFNTFVVAQARKTDGQTLNALRTRKHFTVEEARYMISKFSADKNSPKPNTVSRLRAFIAHMEKKSGKTPMRRRPT